MPNVAVSNVAELNAAEKLPETILETHISRTSQAVKQTDLLTSLFVLLSSLLVLTMIAVLADHWLLTDGLNVLQRFGVLVSLLAVIVFFICRVIIPVLRRSVNPLYAADLIEQTAPSLKNSLINWLLLRKERSEKPNPLPLAERMFDGITKTAAAKVSAMPAERGPGSHSIFWSGIAAAVLMSAFIAYLSFSPKSPMQTLSRIMLPFADIERPQAVEFRNIKPGNTVMLQGERLTVSAEVFGHLNDNVYLVFSTKDGQAVNQRVPMTFDKDAMCYEADFPPGKQGFISDTLYFLEQGKNRSRTFNITVHPTASVEVTSVKYKYPLYTGLEEKTVTEHGDIRAVEGTEAAVSVHSSLPLDEIKLVFDNQSEERMSIAADNANDASVRLELKRNQTQKTYSLSAKDTNGYDSRRSGIFQYEVLPDLPPKVQWSDTAEHLKGVAQLELPEDAALELPVQAEDPDFALRYLRFKIESGDKNLKPVDFIESPSSGPTQHKGQITKTYRFIPKESRLAAGDTADIWVEATDTKFPGGNTAETVRIKITVTKSNKQENKQDNKKDGGKKDDSQKQQQKKENEKQQGEEEQEQQDKEQEKEQGKEQGKGQDKKNEQQQGGETEQEKPKNNEAQQGGSGPKQDGEKQEGGNSGNAGKEKSDQKGEEQTGNQAGGDKPSQDNAGGNADGNAGGQEKQDGNENNDKAQNGKQDAKEKEDSESGNGEPNTREQNNKSNDNGGSKKNSSPNPDTQDGDAMDKIAEQMKQEGIPSKKKQEERQRNNDLDADSTDTDKKGGDSSNPKKRNSKAGADKKQNEKHEHDSGIPKSGESKSDTQQSEHENSEQGKPEQGKSEQKGKQSEQGGQQGGEKGNDQAADNQGNDNNKNNGNNKEGQQGQAAQDASKDTPPQGQKNTSNGQNGGQNAPKQGGSQATSRASATSEEPGTNQSQEPPSGGFGTNTFEQQTAKEDANLEYADKVTNMVLEYLEDQLKDKPDEKLLQKLGWTEEQLRRFYDKWKTLSDGKETEKAKQGTSKDYQEALKSLGLVPDKTDRGLQDNQTKTKDKGRFTESQRFAPPDALKEKFKIYSEGIGK